MIAKIEGLVKLVVKNLPKLGKAKLPMWVIIVFATLYLALPLLFIVAWIDDWKTTGKPDLVMLDTFTKTSAGTTTVIAFLATYLVDKDRDGIPDTLEKEETK